MSDLFLMWEGGSFKMAPIETIWGAFSLGGFLSTARMTWTIDSWIRPVIRNGTRFGGAVLGMLR